MCFEDSFSCFGFELDNATGNKGDIEYAWNGVFDATFEFTTSAPTASLANQLQIDEDESAFGYGFVPGWFSAPTMYDTTITTLFAFNNFQRVNDFYKV